MITRRRFFRTALTLCALTFLHSPGIAVGQSTTEGADVSGPWGASSYDFSLHVAKSTFETINRLREMRGLPTLVADEAIGFVSGSHAGDQIMGDFVGHVTPNGLTLWHRFADAGFQVADAGELIWNATGLIEWNKEDIAQRVVEDWMQAKTGERGILLDPGFNIAAVGTALREKRIVVVAILARR